eukprot:COSAG06_NODE_3457_length_5315_cov_2.923121_5_plen_57_part_00
MSLCRFVALSTTNGIQAGMDVHPRKKYAHVVFFGPIKFMHALRDQAHTTLYQILQK